MSKENPVNNFDKPKKNRATSDKTNYPAEVGEDVSRETPVRTSPICLSLTEDAKLRLVEAATTFVKGKQTEVWKEKVRAGEDIIQPLLADLNSRVMLYEVLNPKDCFCLVGGSVIYEQELSGQVECPSIEALKVKDILDGGAFAYPPCFSDWYYGVQNSEQLGPQEVYDKYGACKWLIVRIDLDALDDILSELIDNPESLFWQKLIDNIPPGEKGDPGPPGPKGDPGDPGPGWTIEGGIGEPPPPPPTTGYTTTPTQVSYCADIPYPVFQDPWFGLSQVFTGVGQLVPITRDPTNIRTAIDAAGYSWFGTEYDPSLLQSVIFTFDGIGMTKGKGGLAGPNVELPYIYNPPTLRYSSDPSALPKFEWVGTNFSVGASVQINGTPVALTVEGKNFANEGLEIGSVAQPIGCNPVYCSYKLVPPPLLGQAIAGIVEKRNANRLFITCMKLAKRAACDLVIPFWTEVTQTSLGCWSGTGSQVNVGGKYYVTLDNIDDNLFDVYPTRCSGSGITPETLEIKAYIRTTVSPGPINTWQIRLVRSSDLAVRAQWNFSTPSPFNGWVTIGKAQLTSGAGNNLGAAKHYIQSNTPSGSPIQLNTFYMGKAS